MGSETHDGGFGSGTDRGFNPGAHRFDFDELARELAGGISRREALRRFGLGLAAAFFADLTGLLPWSPAERAAADPVVPTLHCSSAQAASCVAGIVQQAASAFQACAGAPGKPGSAPDLLPQLQGILAGEVDPGELQPWLRATGTLYCFDTALNEAQTFQQSCLGPGAGCGAGTACSNNLCCPTGLIGCGGLCLDTLNDPINCGADPATACGHRCAAGESCVNGACTGAAGSGNGTGQGNTAGGQGSGGQGDKACELRCTKGCCDGLGVCWPYEVQTTTNCGAAGDPCDICPRGKICVEGGCCVPDTSGKTCCPQQNICFGGSGNVCCEQGCCQYGRGCVALSDQTHDHCGQNGAACVACGPSEDCVNGQCQSSNCHCSGARPSTAFTCCCCPGQANGVWVNLQNGLDPNGHMTGPGFCGSCSTSCASEAVCMNGTCRCPKGGMQVCTDKPCNASLSFKYCDDSGACMGG